jgi:DNA-binding transcriptional LysR family regulator
MDLNLLDLFVTVARTASFSDAGRKLGLPRSSVSRNVGELESALGVQLFNRTTRKVALSTAGASLYERIAPQLLELHKSLDSLPEQDEQPSGELRLTAPTDLGVTVLPDILAGFSQRYPAISLDVRLAQRVVDLVGEGFDLALRITEGRLADSSLVARRLAHVEFELFASPTYLARRGPVRTLEDTATHDWVSFRGPPPAPFPRPALRPRATSDDLLWVHQAVRAGLGVALLPTFLARADVAAGRLLRLLPRHAVRRGVLYFVHPAGAKVRRKVGAFRDYLVEYLSAHPL